MYKTKKETIDFKYDGKTEKYKVCVGTHIGVYSTHNYNMCDANRKGKRQPYTAYMNTTRIRVNTECCDRFVQNKKRDH